MHKADTIETVGQNWRASRILDKASDREHALDWYRKHAQCQI